MDYAVRTDVVKFGCLVSGSGNGRSFTLPIFNIYISDPSLLEDARAAAFAATFEAEEDDDDLYQEQSESPADAALDDTGSPKPPKPPGTVDLLAAAFKQCDVEGRGDLQYDQITTFMDILESKQAGHTNNPNPNPKP